MTVGYTFLIKSCKLDSSGPMASGRMDRKCWLRCGFVCKVTPSTVNKWPCNRKSNVRYEGPYKRDIIVYPIQTNAKFYLKLNKFKMHWIDC